MCTGRWCQSICDGTTVINETCLCLYQCSRFDGNICYRCLTLIPRTQSVLQALIDESKCYNTHVTAMQSCVDIHQLDELNGAGIMLWSEYPTLTTSYSLYRIECHLLIMSNNWSRFIDVRTGHTVVLQLSLTASINVQ